MCRTKVASGSVFTHVVIWSEPEETISSKPDRISSLGNGNSRRSGKELSCFGWMKLHLGRRGGSGASVLFQKDAVPWGPIGPADLGAEGASSASFCSAVQSL